MGKVKSAIITALLVAAIVTLAFFATVSIPNIKIDGSSSRYNAFITNIKLGSEFTGETYGIFYPAGVLTESDYEFKAADESKGTEFADKYVKKNGYYIEKDKLGEDDGAAFAARVQRDAEIISQRFAEKAYTSYSVSVVNDYAIQINAPLGSTYAQYKSYMSGNNASEIVNAFSNLTVSGGIDIRNGNDYETSDSVFGYKDRTPYEEGFDYTDGHVNKYFKGASVRNSGGASFLEISLTDEGVAKINEAISSASTAYLFVGETCLQLSFSNSDGAIADTIYFQIAQGEGYAKSLAVAIDSVVHGNMLINKYNHKDGTSTSLITATPAFGKNAAVWLGAVVLAVLLIAAVCSVIKYRLLGLVNVIMIAAYAVALTTAIYLTGVTLTVVGLFTALVGLAALCFSNFYTFEAVRRESALGRTIPASVKAGYKKTLFGVLDLHIVLVLASIIMALVGVGELASCGIIFLIGSLVSYALYWLTRFMWYVLMSPARDKYRFNGFKREVEEDDE